MKLMQLLLALVGAIVGLAAGIVGMIMTAYKGAKLALTWNLQTDDFREKLIKIIYREFDSSEGVKNVGRAVLRHCHDQGRDDWRKVILEVLSSPEAEPGMAKLIVRLADLREDSKEFVEKNEKDLRRRVQPQTTQEMRQTADEIQLSESELQRSKINQLAKDPLINAPELRDLMMGVLRLMQPSPQPTSETAEKERSKKE